MHLDIRNKSLTELYVTNLNIELNEIFTSSYINNYSCVYKNSILCSKFFIKCQTFKINSN